MCHAVPFTAVFRSSTTQVPCQYGLPSSNIAFESGVRRCVSIGTFLSAHLQLLACRCARCRLLKGGFSNSSKRLVGSLKVSWLFLRKNSIWLLLLWLWIKLLVLTYSMLSPLRLLLHTERQCGGKKTDGFRLEMIVNISSPATNVECVAAKQTLSFSHFESGIPSWLPVQSCRAV